MDCGAGGTICHRPLSSGREKDTETKMKSDNSSKTSAPTEETFLSRWSRRKSEDKTAAPVTPPAESEPTPPPPTDEDMPPVESLSPNDDISGFMSPRVSETLRRRALRRIFFSGKFNLRDGLDDYDDDFTEFTPLGDIITAEMRRQRERVEKALNEQSADAEESQNESQTSQSTADESKDGIRDNSDTDSDSQNEVKSESEDDSKTG